MAHFIKVRTTFNGVYYINVSDIILIRERNEKENAFISNAVIQCTGASYTSLATATTQLIYCDDSVSFILEQIKGN